LEVRRKFAQDIWQRRQLCPITDASADTTITASADTTITAPTGLVLTRREEGREVHISNLALQHRIEQGRCSSSQEAEVRLLPPQGIEQVRLTLLPISGVRLSKEVGHHGGPRGDFL
jgi:hypothetical protein